MKFPDCSPNFRKNYVSDSRKMFLNEEFFITRWSKTLNSSHIVIIDKFYQNQYIKNNLAEKGYQQVILICD